MLVLPREHATKRPENGMYQRESRHQESLCLPYTIKNLSIYMSAYIIIEPILYRMASSIPRGAAGEAAGIYNSALKPPPTLLQAGTQPRVAG